MAARSAASVGIDAVRETARINSYPEPTSVLTATDTGGGTAKIEIADHTRVYPVQGDLDVPDVDLHDIADVTGLANATTYYAYYDDSTLAEETPTVEVTIIPKMAQAGAAPGRHPLGSITTPGGGSPPTSGGGGIRPPGWGNDLP